MVYRIVRTLMAVAIVVLLTACSRQPVSEPPQRDSPSTVSSAPRYGNRPSPPLPDEIRYGALRLATPSQIRTMIDRHGAALVVQSLWGQETDQGWRHVEDGVARGDQVWLDLVPGLRTGADGAVAESLKMRDPECCGYPIA